MAILYDHLGRPIDFDNPDPNFEIPHVFTFGSIMSGGWATYFHDHWDEAMKHRRENALAMKRDAFLMGLMRERFDATLSLRSHVEPDNEKDPTEKATAQAIQKAVKQIRRLRRIKRQALWAIWYGRAGVQLKWGWKTINIPTPVYSGPAESGMKPNIENQTQRVWTILDSRGLNGDKVGFTWNGMPYVLAGAAQGYTGAGQKHDYDFILTTGGPAILLRKAELRRKVLIHTYDPDDSDYFESDMAGGIFGVGVRSRLYWLDWMRREYLSWLTDTFERIGLGLVVIYYDSGNPKAEAEAMKTAKNYSRRSAIVMSRPPDRTWQHGAVEVVEAPIAGAQFVLQLAQAIEAHQERFVIGQSMSAGADNESGLGGSGRALFAADTKHQIISNDAQDLDETLTGSEDDREPGLIDTMFRFTFPDLFGKFPLQHVTNIDEVDPLLKLNAISQAAALGVTFPMGPVRELTGMPAPEDGDEVIGGQPQMPGGAPGGDLGGGQDDGGGDLNLDELLGGGANGSANGKPRF